MPAFVRAFLFKSSPDGELSYYTKNRVQSPTPGHSTYEIISADQQIQVLYLLHLFRIY